MVRNKRYILYVFLFVNAVVFSQEKKIRGKITVSDSHVKGIIVLNLVNEKETVSDEKGEFDILAKPDDLLIFSASHLDKQRKIIEQDDYDSGKFTIEMTSRINELEEVKIVNYRNINAVSLGILQKPAVAYTPAERRLKTATALDATANVGTMMGGALSLDPLLNWISGRTKLLKSELKVEQRELLLKKLDSQYDNEYYTEKLKIREIYINAFRYYVVENEDFVNALNSKNKFMTSFILGSLAEEYKSLLEERHKL